MRYALRELTYIVLKGKQNSSYCSMHGEDYLPGVNSKNACQTVTLVTLMTLVTIKL